MKPYNKDQQFQYPQQSGIIVDIPKSYYHDISILKHLPKPLDILQTLENNLYLPDPICYYSTKLANLSEKIFPSQQNTKNVAIQQTKLFSMENVQFQYKQVKRMFQKSRFRKDDNQNITGSQENQTNKNSVQPKVKTLYNMFFLKVPYYCRFQNHNITKHNFANMFINVAGINLQARLANKSVNLSSNNTKKLPKLFGQKRYNTGNIIFDSNFQSGNLLYVFQKPAQIDGQFTNQFYLITHNDTNTYGHNQWFFFRVQSLKPHLTVKFNIINLIKSDSLFNYGLKPLVFSQKQSQSRNIGWLRRGENVRYFQNQIRRQNVKESYFTLSFQYTFKDIKDWVYFCPSYPYTYTQLTNFVHNLYQQPTYKKCFSIKTLSQTLGRNKINLITISTGQKMIEECKVVWIIARQHPAETTSSYMIEGIIKYLLPLISEAKSSNSQNLQQLNDYVFKIVPMINVDGVIHGNSRAQLVGLDPNRSWKKPRKTINPDTWHVLKEILSYKQNVSMVLDLHSHSKKTGCFFYGNQSPYNQKLSKVYPTLICQNDERFTLKNCRFRGGYKTTARHVLFQQLKIENVFTVECSLLGYLNKKTNRIVQYSIQDYYQMGAKLIQNYFKFQKIKLQKQASQIIEQFSQRIQQVCQVDSAKSDSSVSQDQYDQIKQLQRKLIKKKKSFSVKQSRNKSITQNTIIHQITNQNKVKKRACSFVKDKPSQKNPFKIQPKRNMIFQKGQKVLQRYRSQTTSVNQSNQKILLQPQQTPLQTKLQCISEQPKTIHQSKLRRSYMRYISNSKMFNEGILLKSKTQQTQKNIQYRDFSAQIAILNTQDSLKRVLGTTDSNIINTSIRPLLVLGNPCQSEFYIHGKNQISIQVCLNESSKQNLIKKEHKAIAKLPKLLNLISSTKMKKHSSIMAAKQNSNHIRSTTRYQDTKNILYEQKNRKLLQRANHYKQNMD